MTVSFSSATIRLMAGLEGEVGDQNVTTMPLFSPSAGFRKSTRTQSFFVVRSASPFSSGNMDAPVTVMQVTPCVCQNASMGR